MNTNDTTPAEIIYPSMAGKKPTPANGDQDVSALLFPSTAEKEKPAPTIKDARIGKSGRK